jgi:hypothetical protein
MARRTKSPKTPTTVFHDAKSKFPKYAKTEEKRTYKGREYVVFRGARGGKYIRVNNEYKRIPQ